MSLQIQSSVNCDFKSKGATKLSKHLWINFKVIPYENIPYEWVMFW